MTAEIKTIIVAGARPNFMKVASLLWDDHTAQRTIDGIRAATRR